MSWKWAHNMCTRASHTTDFYSVVISIAMQNDAYNRYHSIQHFTPNKSRAKCVEVKNIDVFSKYACMFVYSECSICVYVRARKRKWGQKSDYNWKEKQYFVIYRWLLEIRTECSESCFIFRDYLIAGRIAVYLSIF